MFPHRQTVTAVPPDRGRIGRYKMLRLDPTRIRRIYRLTREDALHSMYRWLYRGYGATIEDGPTGWHVIIVG